MAAARALFIETPRESVRTEPLESASAVEGTINLPSRGGPTKEEAHVA
jgi:hypothetical protein